MKKGISVVIILSGLFLLAYPSFDNIYSWYWQQKLYNDWEQSEPVESESSNIDVSAEESLQQLDQVFAAETEASQVNPLAATVSAEENNSSSIQQTNDASQEKTKKQSKHSDPLMMGTITIPAIDQKLPILEGATNKNMKIASAHLTGTARFGEVGNSAIAAHRSRTFGRFFNRLDEVKIGDKIIVKDKDQTYTYIVYKKVIVEPNNVSVLNGNGKDKILTLITCDPVDVATHRLIIHAKMK